MTLEILFLNPSISKSGLKMFHSLTTIQGDELDLAKQYEDSGDRRRKSSFIEQISNLLKNIL